MPSGMSTTIIKGVCDLGEMQDTYSVSDIAEQEAFHNVNFFQLQYIIIIF